MLSIEFPHRDNEAHIALARFLAQSAVLLCIAVLVLVDLNRPRRHPIEVSRQSMLKRRADMNPAR